MKIKSCLRGKNIDFNPPKILKTPIKCRELARKRIEERIKSGKYKK